MASAEGNAGSRETLQFGATVIKRVNASELGVAVRSCSKRTLAEYSFHCSSPSCPLQIKPTWPSGFLVWLEETMSLTKNLPKLPEEEGWLGGQLGTIIN